MNYTHDGLSKLLVKTDARRILTPFDAKTSIAFVPQYRVVIFYDQRGTGASKHLQRDSTSKQWRCKWLT